MRPPLALPDVTLGEPAFQQMIRGVSIGKLKTYQLYERVKLRFHLSKLNSETLRKAEPRLWQRVASGDDEFATDVAQVVLHLHGGAPLDRPGHDRGCRRCRP